MRKVGCKTSRFTRSFARASRGFTVMEMLVSIAVILILASMTMKGLTEMNRVRKLSNSTETVAAVISQARRMAISDNRIYHVRVDNKSTTEQYICVYRFKKMADAINATTEDAVQTMTSSDPTVTAKGWANQYGPGQYTNELVLRRPLETGVLFETEYDTSKLYNTSARKMYSTYSVSTHLKGSEDNLVYSYPSKATPAGMNWLPQTSTTPFYDASGNFTGTLNNALLYFNPDGTSGANVLLLLRDDFSLQFVQVLKGGVVRTGDLRQLSDFKQIK